MSKRVFLFMNHYIKKTYKGSHEMYNAHSYLGTDKIQTYKNTCQANRVCFDLLPLHRTVYIQNIMKHKYTSLLRKQGRHWVKVIVLWKQIRVTYIEKSHSHPKTVISTSILVQQYNLICGSSNKNHQNCRIELYF